MSAPRWQAEEEGLPEQLPAGERVLWQGRPCWQTLARRAFHLRFLAAYFAVLLTWYAASAALSPAGAGADALAVLRMGAVALTPLGVVLLYSWMTSRSSLYTITERRVVMRIGIAMPITFNLPFSHIESAGLKSWGTGHGDISLTLPKSDRLAYLVMWPHARPWRMARTEPMLRCIPEARRVAQILSRALAISADMPISAGVIASDAERQVAAGSAVLA